MAFCSSPPRTPPPPAMPPLLPASAAATRFAAHWVADALAGDEALDLSVLKALVGASSESLVGAPEATRERVALRCLEEVSAAVAAGGDAAAAAKVLRDDGARSCEDLLLQLVGEVGSTGNLEKDLLPPFSQDIRNIICIKKPTLPKTSFELLREVDPEITHTAPPSQLEQNATSQLDNDQSLCSSQDHVNIEKPRLPADNGELQQEALVNLVDKSDTRSIEKDSVAPTSVLHQPCTSDSRCYYPPEEDAIGASSLGARSPERSPIVEGNFSVATTSASASCDAALQHSITDPLSKHVTEDHTTMVQSQFHREMSPSTAHYDGERPHDASSNLSSKDPRHEELSVHTIVNPDIDRSCDVLPANASEPEFITEQDTAMISQPNRNGTHLSPLQHESGEKANQDLDDISAIIQPVEKDHVYEELTQQASCDEALQRSITGPLSKHATEDHTTMVQPQFHREISPSPADYVDGERLHDGSSDLSSKDPRHEELSVHTIVNPDIDRSCDVLPANASKPEFITAQDTAMISQPCSNGTHLSALQHESGEKANQVLDDVSAIIKPVEKDHVHEELTQKASVLPSVVCNGAIQGGKYETNHQPGDTAAMEIGGANQVNQALHDGGIHENHVVNDGLNPQNNPMLHDKISEANYLSEGDTRENRTDIQKCASVPSSAQDGDGESAMKISNKENLGDASVEISVPSSDDSLCGTAAAGLLAMTDRVPFFTKGQDINDSLGDLSQQDLCIKCGKDGQLLKCSSCLLAAHDICFGSSATFEETGLFYCPVCFYRKATEAYQKAKQTYCEARKNLAAFFGTAQLVAQHGEQPAGVMPGAANGQGLSNGCDLSKRSIHQNEADNFPYRQSKKQKINAKGNGHSEQVVSEKVPFPNSDVAPMNKHPVVKNNGSKRVKGAEKHKQVEKKESCKEAGNDNSSHETRSSLQKECCSPSNQEVESDRQDGLGQGHLNGCDLSKRSTHQNEADNLPYRQNKKQKINAKGNGHSEKVVSEKVPFPNSDVAPMNKHAVVKNNSSKRVQGAEKHKQVEKKESCKEAGNDNSSHETSSSHNEYGPPSNQEVESHRQDGLANSHQPEDSNESEATSSNDSGNRSSPPWRKMRHNKARLHGKETTASRNSRKTAQEDQIMHSSSRQKDYAYPQKRYSNPVVPSGRRSKLCWTEEEEAVLKEAMAKFTPQDDAPIPWVQILAYGRDVFHRTRLPPDLRVKWRNMKKKGVC